MKESAAHASHCARWFAERSTWSTFTASETARSFRDSNRRHSVLVCQVFCLRLRPFGPVVSKFESSSETSWSDMSGFLPVPCFQQAFDSWHSLTRADSLETRMGMHLAALGFLNILDIFIVNVVGTSQREICGQRNLGEFEVPILVSRFNGKILLKAPCGRLSIKGMQRFETSCEKQIGILGFWESHFTLFLSPWLKKTNYFRISSCCRSPAAGKTVAGAQQFVLRAMKVWISTRALQMKR